MGGGNVGNLYPKAERDRRKIIKSFKNTRILSLPQSVYFSKDVRGDFELKKSRHVYSKKKNLTLIARDNNSLKKLKKLNQKTLLTPDIVFYFNKIKGYDLDRKDDVLFILRNDNEKQVSDANINKIIGILRQKGLNYQLSDTTVNENFIQEDERKRLLKDKFNQFLKSKLVITDRLHGMIFSYLTRTPCMVIANNNGKIKATYNTWLKDISFIKFVDRFNIQNLNEIVDYMLSVKVDLNKDFDSDLFDPIKDWMNK